MQVLTMFEDVCTIANEDTLNGPLSVIMPLLTKNVN